MSCKDTAIWGKYKIKSDLFLFWHQVCAITPLMSLVIKQ